MGYVALIGLYFVPILCLLSAGWSYVRWKNEHEDEALAERKKLLRSAGSAPTETAGAFLSPRLLQWWSFWH